MTEGDRLKQQILLYKNIEHQYKISAYTDESLIKIQKGLNKARRELFFELGQRDFRIPEGREHAVLEQLNNMTLGIQGQLTGDIKEAAKIAGETSIREYDKILSFDGALDSTVGFNYTSLSPVQLEAMVNAPVGGKLLETWVANSFSTNIIEGIETSISAGMLRGLGTEKIIAELKKSFNMIDRDAETLARTHIAAVNNAAAEKVYKANADIIKYEVWSASLEVGLSGRSTCPRCAILDSRRFKIDEPHIRPPLHLR